MNEKKIVCFVYFRRGSLFIKDCCCRLDGIEGGTPEVGTMNGLKKLD